MFLQKTENPSKNRTFFTALCSATMLQRKAAEKGNLPFPLLKKDLISQQR